MDTALRTFLRISILGAISWTVYMNYFAEASCKFTGSRAKADFRTMATAIETYYVDFGRYPDWSIDPKTNAFGAGGNARRSAIQSIPSFRTKMNNGMAIKHLTTPTAYLPAYFTDEFASEPNLTYAYWPHEIMHQGRLVSNGWLTWSPGPDGDYDITIENVASLYDSIGRVPSVELLECCTYDPTNGATSNGDIYRTKQ